MIRRVRKSFILITMTMLTLVLIIPLCALNIITSALTYNQTQKLLEQIAQTEIYILEPPAQPPEEHSSNEEERLGVVKPPHTSGMMTTTTAVTTTVTTTTATTTVPDDDQTQQNKFTTVPSPQEPVKTDRTGGTVPSVQQTQEPPQMTSPVFTEPPVWSEPAWTEPVWTEQVPAWTKPSHNDFQGNGNGNGNGFNDNQWRGWGAVSFPLKNFSIAHFLAQSSLLKQTAEVTSASTTTAVTTAVTTRKNRIVTEKQLDQERRREESLLSTSNSIDHFVVYLNQTGDVTDVHGSTQYTSENCVELISQVNDSQKSDGRLGTLQFVKKDYSKGAVVVFSDRQSDISMLKNLLFVSITVFILMEIIVFFLTRILTKRAMRPMQVSYEKQQQFISDAGHELKTPLTIISANADILADEIGENKWLTYIKSQAERMRILVQEMMDLMKISGTEQHLAQSHFNISSLVENVALPFECQAFEQKKTFHLELEPEVEFFGNTEQIRRMVGIFIDNAFKYSNENGTIQVTLKTENGKKILKIHNTGAGIEKGEEEKIFERFYRSDSSRSRQTGGYGLGLAIAKSIADQHHIKIQVITEPGQWISFNLIL